jgi:hypothetical protein
LEAKIAQSASDGCVSIGSRLEGPVSRSATNLILTRASCWRAWILCLLIFYRQGLDLQIGGPAFRLRNNSKRVCVCVFCSIFWWTNETVNIWSHIFGWMLFLGLTLYDLILLNIHASALDKLIVGLLLLCFQV